jgi:hypothetical protein
MNPHLNWILLIFNYYQINLEKTAKIITFNYFYKISQSFLIKFIFIKI